MQSSGSFDAHRRAVPSDRTRTSSHRRLDQPVTVWRIGDLKGDFPVWSPVGTTQDPGRWNLVGEQVIYTATSFPLALLEKLAHWSGSVPLYQHYVEVVVAAGASYEEFAPDLHVGWSLPDSEVASDFGSRWLREQRSAILFVPSVIAPMCQNVLVNPLHPEAAQIAPGREKPVPWDRRLLRT